MKKLNVKQLTMRSVPVIIKSLIEKSNELIEKIEEVEDKLKNLNTGAAKNVKQKVVQSKASSKQSPKQQDKPDV